MSLINYKECIQKKFESIEHLYKNTLEQNTALEEDDVEKYVKLLDEREEIIKEIERIDNMLSNVESNDKEHMHKMFEEIQEIEDKNMILAKKIKDEATKKINEINLSKKTMNSGYNSPNSFVNGIYFDKSIGSKK